MAEMRPTPQNSTLAAVADALRRAQQFTGQYQVLPQVPLLGGTGIDELLGLPGAAREVENWSYGNYPVRVNPYAGRTASFVPEVKPGRKQDLADTVLLGADLVPAGALANRAVAAGARRLEDATVGALQRSRIRAAAARVPDETAYDPLRQRMEERGNLMYSIKPKGGNWLGRQVERQLEPLIPHIPTEEALARAEAVVPTAGAEIRADAAINAPLKKWLETKLTKYIKNEMATPEDPLRLQADTWAERQTKLLADKQAQIDKATADMQRAQRERGVEPEMLTRSRERIRQLEKERDAITARTGLHFNAAGREFGVPQYRVLQQYRESLGYPAESQATSQTGRSWEDIADYYLQQSPAGDIIKENYFLRPQDAERIYAENPWLYKVPPETKVYSLNRGMTQQDTGFKHMTDELRNALNPNSGLPEDLLITPKDLEKMTVAQAADLVDKINAHRAVQKAEADALLAQKSIEVFKEYPETEEGLRWVEMKVLDDDKLPEGYQVTETKVPGTLAVRDPDGKQVALGKDEADAVGNFFRRFPEQSKTRKDLEEALKYEGDIMQHCVGGYCPDVVEGHSRIFSLRDNTGKPAVTIEVKPGKRTGERAVDYRQLLPENYAAKYGDDSDLLPYIEQIKGPKNERPDEKYLPFVQDFVKSQRWGDVKDLQNTGLMSYRGQYVSPAELEYLTEDQQWVNLADYAKSRFPDSAKQQSNFIRGAIRLSSTSQ